MDRADLDAATETWAANQVAKLVAMDSRVTPEMALECARWACRWIEAYKTLAAEWGPGNEDDLHDIMVVAFDVSLAVSPEVPRYSPLVPTLTATSAAMHVFCQTFGEQAAEAERIFLLRNEQAQLAKEVQAKLA